MVESSQPPAVQGNIVQICRMSFWILVEFPRAPNVSGMSSWTLRDISNVLIWRISAALKNMDFCFQIFHSYSLQRKGDDKFNKLTVCYDKRIKAKLKGIFWNFLKCALSLKSWEYFNFQKDDSWSKRGVRARHAISIGWSCWRHASRKARHVIGR